MSNTLNKYTNKEKADIFKNNYDKWKKNGMDNHGFFIIFNGFVTSGKLKMISGNALKLYIYLNTFSNSENGEVWHSNKSISKYFGKSERTIRNWMKELEDLNLVIRMQLQFNGPSHNYLQTYDLGDERKK